MPRKTLAAYAKRKGIRLKTAETRWRRAVKHIAASGDARSAYAVATAAFKKKRRTA